MGYRKPSNNILWTVCVFIPDWLSHKVINWECYWSLEATGRGPGTVDKRVDLDLI